MSGYRATYGHDARDERVAWVDSAEPGIHYTLRGLSNEILQEVHELSGVWTWRKDYIFAGGTHIATVDSSGLTHVHKDHLGSTRVITSASGSIVSQHRYWPFGEEMTATSSSERMRFAGHERDSQTSLDYMHARYYAPFGGRFLSVDPGRDFDPSHPQSWNLYAYVRNNPVNATDPTGRWWVLQGKSESDIAYLKNVLIEAARRPQLRALVVEMGSLTKRVTLENASLNDQKRWAAYRMRQPTRFEFGRTSRGRDGFLVQMDSRAIEGPGAQTGHRGGLVTFGHEVGSHLKDLLAGRPTEAIKQTDDDGTAERIGRELAQERPDLSRAEAEKLVEELLRLGQLYERQQGK
ncbi:MAG: RHS repeat domain-containing protein, partial [Bacillota bacterium]